MHDLDLTLQCHFCGKFKQENLVSTQVIKKEKVEAGIYNGMSAAVNTLHWCNDVDCKTKAKEWLMSGNEDLPELKDKDE